MSEKKEVATEVAVLTPDNIGEVIESGKLEELFKSKKRAGFSLTSEYLSMESGQVERFAVMQKSTMTVDDEDENNENGKREIECLLMVNSKGNTVTAAQTVLVGAIKNNIPCMVEIECKGEVKMSGGRKYTDFDVFILQ